MRKIYWNHLIIYAISGHSCKQANRKNQSYLWREHGYINRLYHEVYQRYATISYHEKITHSSTKISFLIVRFLYQAFKKIMNPYVTVDSFLQTINEHLTLAGIELEKHTIDHLCRRSATLEEFEANKTVFMELSTHYNETIFREKTFFVFFLKEPIIVWDQEIFLIEYPAPSTRTPYATWRQHIEICSPFQITELINTQAEQYLVHKSYNNWDTETYLLRDNLTALKVIHKPLWYKIMQESGTFTKI